MISKCRRGYRIIFALAMICSLGSFTSEAAARDANAYFTIDSFTWEEFEDDGSRLLKESGQLFGLGVTYWTEYENHITFKPGAEIFGGIVDYDGQACGIDEVTLASACEPATTDVDYFGLKVKADVGRRLRPGNIFYLEPFGGLEARAWLRSINDGRTADGEPTAGYNEGWFIIHGRLGLRTGLEFSKTSRIFAEGGVRLPLVNQNTAYQRSAGIGANVTMSPGRESSSFAETGVKIDRLSITLFYDGLRFSKSAPVASGSSIYWQPKSSMDVYGIRLGYVF